MKKTTRKSGSGEAMKEAFALRSELKRYGVDTVEELREKMEAVLGSVPAETATVSVPRGAETPATTAAPPDDLLWIGRDHFEVHLVLRKHNLILRAARPALQPPIERISLKPYATATSWNNMPFTLRHENNERQKFLRIKYAKWNYFCISRDVAEDMFSDPRSPIPTRAVISHEEYRGWSHASKRAVGIHRDLVDPDPLREAVRRVLQRFSGQLFINSAYHKDMPDYRIVNPYGNHIDEFAIPVPRVLTPEVIETKMPEIVLEKR